MTHRNKTRAADMMLWITQVDPVNFRRGRNMIYCKVCKSYLAINDVFDLKQHAESATHKSNILNARLCQHLPKLSIASLNKVAEIAAEDNIGRKESSTGSTTHIGKKGNQLRKVNKGKEAKIIDVILNRSNEVTLVLSWNRLFYFLKAKDASQKWPQLVIDFYEKRKTPSGHFLKEIGPNGVVLGLNVETIESLEKRSGELRFRVKWRGSNETHLISTKDANILWPQLVIAWYEERITWNDHIIPDHPEGWDLTGFERGLEPEKILAVGFLPGEIKIFQIQWKGTFPNDTNLVLVSEANKKCPQVVIQFYMANLKFHY